LTYALNLGERYVRHGGTNSWPAFAAYPVAKDWNYGLLPDLSLFKVVVRQVDPNDPNVQPFSPAAAPIEITAAAKKIDQWQVDRFGLVGALQSSPAQSDEPTKRVTLIPMGAERLRISEFPTVSASGKGARWALPRLPKRPIPASSSHTNPSDTLDALSSGLLPKSSGDASIQRFTWWDRKGDVEWVQYDFPKARSLSSAEVYWFDDRSSGGGCRAPRSWRLLALVGSEWKEVAARSVYGVQLDQFNAVSFDPIVTQHLRLEVKLEDGFSGGVLQWRVR
jgi:hypothetical protein